MINFIYEHRILLSVLLFLILLVIGWFITINLVYLRSQKEAFLEITNKIIASKTKQDLIACSFELHIFKQEYTSDEKGADMWIEINEIYDETLMAIKK